MEVETSTAMNIGQKEYRKIEAAEIHLFQGALEPNACTFTSDQRSERR